MANKIVTLKDANNDVILPRTLVNAVQDGDGNKLEDILKALDKNTGVSSINTKTGDVTITASDVDAYTKTEVDVLLGDKVATADYEAYTTSNDVKVNASVKDVAFNNTSNELTITKTDNSTKKVDLSSLSNGGGTGSFNITNKEW